MYLREVVPAGPKAHAEAERVRRRLLAQVDDSRHARTSATVDYLLDKHFELVKIEMNTIENCRSAAEHHIRPLIGAVRVGALNGKVFDSFYAELLRCRIHCDGRPMVDHRTWRPHGCDPRCTPHVCKPLGASSVRQIQVGSPATRSLRRSHRRSRRLSPGLLPLHRRRSS